MLSALVITYLFCGGAGAGALAVACCTDGMARKHYMLFSGEIPAQSGESEFRCVAWVYAVGLFVLLFGIACLLCDLGRADRIVMLFLVPRFSWITLGTYLLIVLVFSGLLIVAANFCAFELPQRPYQIARRFVFISAIATMLYTGLFLFDLYAVAFWSSYLIPLLFLLSSCSCGCAVYFICAYFIENQLEKLPIVMQMVRADMVFIGLEMICAIAFMATMLHSSRSAALTSAKALFAISNEQLPLLWWLGFIVCGMLVPIVIESLCQIKLLRGYARPGVSAICAFVAVSVLVGSASMRAGIVLAGSHADLGMAEPEIVFVLENGTL